MRSRRTARERSTSISTRYLIYFASNLSIRSAIPSKLSAARRFTYSSTAQFNRPSALFLSAYPAANSNGA